MEWYFVKSDLEQHGVIQVKKDTFEYWLKMKDLHQMLIGRVSSRVHHKHGTVLHTFSTVKKNHTLNVKII